MSSKVSAMVYVKALAVFEVGAGECVEDSINRTADIYLHAPGPDGHVNKEDIGGDTILIDTSCEEKVLVDKGLLIALLETANRTTDLESIYDDKNNAWTWKNINKFMHGLKMTKNKRVFR